MRLMTADTAEYPLRRAETVTSGYVGTKNVYVSAGTVTGQLAPLTDSFSVEMYGDKAASMYSLTCAGDPDIRKNDRVVLEDGDYTVISVMRYQTHITASLERAGAYGDRDQGT